jgi:O-antigen ligase
VKFKELLVYFTFFTTMILQNLLYLNFSQFFLFTIIAISLVVLERSKRIYFLFFIIPFRSSLPFNLIIIFFLILLFFSYKLKLSRIFFLLFVISTIEMITSFESNNTLDSIRFLSILVTLFLIVNISTKEFPLSGNTIGLYFSFGFIFSGLLYLIVFSNYFSIELLFVGQSRLGAIYDQFNRFHPNYMYYLNINANEIGINAIFSMIFLSLNYKKSSFFFFIFFFLTLLIGTLSFSRTFFLSLAIFFFYIFTRIVIIKSFSTKIFILSTLVLSLFLLVFFNSDFDLLSIIFERFLEAKSDERIDITLNYLKLLDFSNVFFGKGSINYYYYYNQEYSLHNGFLEFFFSYGLFGLIFFLLFLWFLFRKSRSQTLIQLGLVTFLLVIMFHQFLASVQLIFILGIFFILIKDIKYNKKYEIKIRV